MIYVVLIGSQCHWVTRISVILRGRRNAVWTSIIRSTLFNLKMVGFCLTPVNNGAAWTLYITLLPKRGNTVYFHQDLLVLWGVTFQGVNLIYTIVKIVNSYWLELFLIVFSALVLHPIARLSYILTILSSNMTLSLVGH